MAEGGGGATPPDAAWRHLELRLAGETARADAADAARAELEARVVAAAPVVCPPLTAEAGTWTGEGGDDEVETESEGGQQTRASLLASLEAALDEERRAAAGARVDVAASAASAEAARAEAAHWRREVVAAVAAATLECALESASGAAAAVKEALAKAERVRGEGERGSRGPGRGRGEVGGAAGAAVRANPAHIPGRQPGSSPVAGSAAGADASTVGGRATAHRRPRPGRLASDFEWGGEVERWRAGGDMNLSGAGGRAGWLT